MMQFDSIRLLPKRRLLRISDRLCSHVWALLLAAASPSAAMNVRRRIIPPKDAVG
jgi:hypothetical protein